MTKPKHIAFIMDGNGRWAKQKGFERSDGHLAGAKTVRTILKACVKHEIPYVSLYAFSTENWNRPKDEVSTLFKLFCDFVKAELPLMLEHKIRLSIIGDKSGLPKTSQKALEYAIQKTAHGTNTELILALNYSGTQEICRAARNGILELLSSEQNLEKISTANKSDLTKVINEIISTENFSEQELRAHLFQPSVPDPDLIIRTGGELRLSNFYLLQAAYAELYFCDTFWPDFQEEDLNLALEAFAKRKRRFGAI